MAGSVMSSNGQPVVLVRAERGGTVGLFSKVPLL